LTLADVASQPGDFTADLDVGLIIYNAGSGRIMGLILMPSLGSLGRGRSFIPGAAHRKRVRAIWPTPRIRIIQANAKNFGSPFHVLQDEEFGDV